jgi:energy-coupling factor transporter ATP-binding protein EcfA2
MDFKILAIRTGDKPIDNNHVNYLKVLEANKLYKFYNDYDFLHSNEHNDDIISVSYKPTIPDILIKIKTERKIIPVNISAIVGKNGSGKSTIIDLIIKAINNLSYYYNINEDIENLEELDLELYFKTNAYYKIAFKKQIIIYKQEINSDRFINIYKEEFDFNNFFYSIIINYSHFGLNAKESGTWLNSLFHKNDGYQTPIVINPMRTDGNIDVNIESDLTKARFIANLLSNKLNKTHLKITENLYVDSLRLVVKETDDNKILYTYTTTETSTDKSKSSISYENKIRFNDLQINFDLILQNLNQQINFNYKHGDWDSGSLIQKKAFKYIITKLVKICVTYPLYNDFFDKQNKHFRDVMTFFTTLLDKNQNHISFKLLQTINYLRLNVAYYENNGTGVLNISEIANFNDDLINKNNLDPDYRILLIPPPIFKTEIILKSSPEDKNEISFNSLSSGEKQLIFSINSIIYQLINIDSVKRYRNQKSYRFVNIILEEVELYFHPEFQRTFINMLFDKLQDLYLKRIESLNICFVTHSPFILSDIPSQNILFLTEKGSVIEEIKIEKTFGSNIHDLLKSSFFLNNGYMGEFAKTKILDLVEYLKKDEKEDYNGEWTYENSNEFIELIGEPIIRERLLMLFDKKFFTEDKEIVKRRIKKLQETLNKL